MKMYSAVAAPATLALAPRNTFSTQCINFFSWRNVKIYFLYQNVSDFFQISINHCSQILEYFFPKIEIWNFEILWQLFYVKKHVLICCLWPNTVFSKIAKTYVGVL